MNCAHASHDNCMAIYIMGNITLEPGTMEIVVSIHINCMCSVEKKRRHLTIVSL